MPDVSPAAELHAAAETLREHAAGATKGPWWTEDTSPARWGDNPDAKVASADGTLAVLLPEWNGPLNAAWIAVMHPAVGTALADWLDHAADDHTPGDVTKMYPVFEEYQVCDRCDSPHERDEVRWPCPAITHALTVARAIITPAREPLPDSVDDADQRLFRSEQQGAEARAEEQQAK